MLSWSYPPYFHRLEVREYYMVGLLSREVHRTVAGCNIRAIQVDLPQVRLLKHPHDLPVVPDVVSTCMCTPNGFPSICTRLLTTDPVVCRVIPAEQFMVVCMDLSVMVASDSMVAVPTFSNVSPPPPVDRR